MNQRLMAVASVIAVMATGVLFTATAAAQGATPCADGSGPKTALENYLTAMQQHRFADAYAFVGVNMTDGKSRDEWAALQKLFYEGGDVNILSIDIRAPQGTAADSACMNTAQVPNVLKSRDKFNNQGTTEFEVYVAVKDGEAWKIDGQETLFEQTQVDKWFPGEQMPEFRDQY